MASEDTLIGNELRLQMGDGASPEVFADFCAITDVSGLGETKALIDVTAMCDPARRYRGGLAEGSEVTITANLIQGDAQTRALFQSYKADEVVNFRMLVNPGNSPQEMLVFSASILGWTISAPIGEKASMAFTVKISGGVNWVYT